MTAPPIVDWPLLLVYLRKHNGPLSRLAPRVGMCEKTINRLARGEIAEPRFSAGVALLDVAYECLPPEDWRQFAQSSRFG